MKRTASKVIGKIWDFKARIKAVTSCSTHKKKTNRRQMVKVLTYDIPDYKIKLKIRQLQVMGKKIQGKLITQAMDGTLVANRCNHQVLWIE